MLRRGHRRYLAPAMAATLTVASLYAPDHTKLAAGERRRSVKQTSLLRRTPRRAPPCEVGLRGERPCLAQLFGGDGLGCADPFEQLGANTETLAVGTDSGKAAEIYFALVYLLLYPPIGGSIVCPRRQPGG